MGIEPTSEAWEASILPLYDARSFPYGSIIHNEMPASTDRRGAHVCGYLRALSGYRRAISTNERARRGSSRSTIHNDLRAGDVGSFIRRQVQRRFSDLLRFTHTTLCSRPRRRPTYAPGLPQMAPLVRRDDVQARG